MTAHRFAVTRRPGRSLADGERTYVGRVAVDHELAEAQHAAYRAALADAGLTLIDLPALDDFGDAAFVEDTAVLIGNAVVLARPGAPNRRGEVESIAAALPAQIHQLSLSAAATLDGGDVLRIGDTVYVGISSRTSARAASELETLVAPLGFKVVPVAVHGALHLKTAVTAIDDHSIVLNPAWLDTAPFTRLSQIAVDPAEPFGGNILRLPDRILCAASAPRTMERIRKTGVDIVSLDISEFAKAEAGLTCLSLISA